MLGVYWGFDCMPACRLPSVPIVHPTGHSARRFSNTVTCATYFRRNHCNPVSDRRFRLFRTVAVRFEAAVLVGGLSSRCFGKLCLTTRADPKRSALFMFAARV